MSIRVVLADDQALLRKGFRMILEAEDDIDIVGEAADGADAVRLIELYSPDVVLMDVRMPVLDGIGATRAIVGSEAAEATRVLILTTFDLDEYAFSALPSRSQRVPAQGRPSGRPGGRHPDRGPRRRRGVAARDAGASSRSTPTPCPRRPKAQKRPGQPPRTRRWPA